MHPSVKQAAMAACLMIAAPAWAAPGDGSAMPLADAVVGGEIADARVVNLALQGSIRQRCMIGTVPNMNFGDLARSNLSITARVALDCNIPFTMNIKGQNGALTHRTMPNGQGPYSGSVPYSVSVQMPVRRPSESIVSRAFGSAELRAGGIVSSDGGIATDGMVMAVTLGAPSGEAGLLAGTYGETITITVAPT